MLRAVLHLVVTLLFRIVSRLDVRGQENVPASGGAILASNHLHLLDAPLMFVVVKRTDLVPLVAHTHRKTWWLRWLVDATNGIWINRGAADLNALRLCRQHLARGGMVGIAPEGTRSRTGVLIEAKTGTVFLAEKARVPIVPVALWGTESALAQIKRLRRPMISVRFGEPLYFPPLGSGNHEAILERSTLEMMLRIAAMLPEQYRGFYRDLVQADSVGKTS